MLNFLPHGPYEQLNPGFSGNSHLLSVMGISIPHMGKSKGIFFPVTELQGNTSSSLILVPHIKNAHLCSLGMICANEPDGWQSKHWSKCSSTILSDCIGFPSAVAPCETYSLGSSMIKVHVSRIMCSHLEGGNNHVAKSYMRNTITQPGLGSKVSLPKSSDEKQSKYQAAVVQKNLN